MNTKTSPHAKFFKLLQQIPNADKESLVWIYSNEKTISLSELFQKNRNAYNEMLGAMEKTVNSMYNAEDKARLKKLRSGILFRLQKHGVDTTDWSKVNAFMKQSRIAGKTLGEMSIAEMQDFIKKIESILKKDAVAQEKMNRLTKLN